MTSDLPAPSMPAGISARQRRAIPIVLASPTLEKGFKAAGISKTTWWNWKAQAPFLRAVEAVEGATWAETLERAKTACLRAVDKISELIDHKDPRVALQASQALLSYSLKVSELLDMRREIQEIRARLKMDESGGKGTP